MTERRACGREADAACLGLGVCEKASTAQALTGRGAASADAYGQAAGRACGSTRPALQHLGPHEVDEAALDVGADELDAHAVADVEALAPVDDLALDGGPADPHPRALRATRR